MTKKALLGAITSIILALTGNAQNQADSGPVFPKGFVGNPEFNTTAGRQSAGTAFLARTNDSNQVYILTVRHLLGPEGGFRALTPPEKVPSFVRSIRLGPFAGGGAARDHFVEGLSVPPSPDPKGPLADLAIFKTRDASQSDAPLIADEKPALGETVWVIAQVRGGVPNGQLVHPAKVRANGDRWLVCEFDNPNIITNGASGAPVLNAAGKVVGIYSGHSSKGGKVWAYAIPSPLILQVIHGMPAPAK